jgi:hypothetical protein
MNATLEDRLRRHYDARTRDLPARGPGLDDGLTLRTNVLRPAARPNRAARTLLGVGSIAAVIAFGIVVVNRPTPTSENSSVGANEPTPTDGSVVDDATPPPQSGETLTPVETLPPSADVSDTPEPGWETPSTVWYRLQPDLHIAWAGERNLSPALLCWRTPVGSECVKDNGALPLIVPTAGGQTLVVVWAEGLRGDTLDVQLVGGAVLSTRFELDDDSLGWGVARYLLPEGERIAAVGTASAAASEVVEYSGQTLPPTVGLEEAPVWAPAGSELSYWRWFPDLDISERATTSGGTEMCWRTPVGTGCIEDSFISPKVGIIPTDGGVILIVRRAVRYLASPGPVPTTTLPSVPTSVETRIYTLITTARMTITATMSDGSTATVVVDEGEAFDIGHARLALAPGVTVISATAI